MSELSIDLVSLWADREDYYCTSWGSFHDNLYTSIAVNPGLQLIAKQPVFLSRLRTRARTVKRMVWG